MTATDWSQYLVEEPEAEVQQPQQKSIQQPVEPTDWSQYLQKGQTSTLDEGKRHAARIASRVSESLVGMPGNVVKFADWLGSKLPKVPDFLQSEPTYLQNKGKQLLEALPTSEELKSKVSELTKGYTDPEGAFEEFGDSVIELATALTIGRDPTKVNTFVSSLGKALAAKGAKEGVKQFGGSENLQLASEIGSLVLMDTFNSNAANRYIDDKYAKARNLVGDKSMINTRSLQSDLKKLSEELSTGLSTNSKNEVKSAVDELANKSSGGALPAEQLVESFHDLNERMSSKKLFSELSKVEQKKLKFRYDKLKDVVGNEIEKYGQKNPQFLKEWKEANAAYSAVQNSKKASEYISKNLNRLGPHASTGVAIKLFEGYPAAAVGGYGAFKGLQLAEVIASIAKHPQLAKAYSDVLLNASAENFPAMANSFKKLDTGLKQELFSQQD